MASRRRLIGLCAAAVLIAGMVAGVGGLRLSAYRLISGSMAPAFPAGTVVITSGAAAVRLHYPVSFTADGRTVTHILVGYNPDGSLITRGIANPRNDRWQMPVYPRDIRGRVVCGVLLFAPTFWASSRGMTVALGCLLWVLVLCLIIQPVSRHGAMRRDTMRQ